MRHFTCDLCRRPLSGNERYVANIEVVADFDADELTEDDLETDHLQQVAALIEHIEETGEEPEDDVAPRQFSFDLCHTCRQRFVRDPLGRDLPRRLDFSKN